MVNREIVEGIRARWLNNALLDLGPRNTDSRIFAMSCNTLLGTGQSTLALPYVDSRGNESRRQVIIEQTETGDDPVCTVHQDPPNLSRFGSCVYIVGTQRK